MNWTQEQMELIRAWKGGVLALAPAGSGKTLVLSARVAEALLNGIDPARVLCLTFTNRAAKEMEARIAAEHAELTSVLVIKTFHAFCTMMIKQEAAALALNPHFVIYDEDDAAELAGAIWGIPATKPRERQDVLSHIHAAKAAAPIDQLSLHEVPESVFSRVPKTTPAFIQNAHRYQTTLRERHALDFADLVFFARALLHRHPEAAQRWRNRFDLIQVDELQDTHEEEYEIVCTLARKSGNLAMVGDLDQAIYGWRGADPHHVIRQFKKDFHPREFSLTWNFRSTRTLLRVASIFADCMETRFTQCQPSHALEAGGAITTTEAVSAWDEAISVASQVGQAMREDPAFKPNRAAVLTRTHKRAETISRAMLELGVPHITVEQYAFFRRQEIKDALARLRLLINPHDAGAARRVLERPACGAGPATMRAIADAGLRLNDLFLERTHRDGDPYSRLLREYAEGSIVVMDVETTGVESEDEIIELAAARLEGGVPSADFQAFILPRHGRVSDTTHVHGYTEEEIRRVARPAPEVFRNFEAFRAGALLVGHNVSFDAGMLQTNAAAHGVTLSPMEFDDTLDIARRFVTARSYRLSGLVNHFNIQYPATHHAIDDVRATAALLGHLIPEVARDLDRRSTALRLHGAPFASLAASLAEWRAAAQTLRPKELLHRVLQESGLIDSYGREKRRLENLRDLYRIFDERDIATLPPPVSLRALMDFTALSRQVDHITRKMDTVLVIPVHQSKGLEFDHVWVAGLSEGEFPGFRSREGDALEEEKRLFYVALTRARQRLALSWHLSDNAFSRRPSPFITHLRNHPEAGQLLKPLPPVASGIPE
jgi:DNA helicase-2/ATP-dependent DNA helicase PcrA